MKKLLCMAMEHISVFVLLYAAEKAEVCLRVGEKTTLKTKL